MENESKNFSNYKIKNFTLLPYYNGNNLSFFKKNVFIEEHEILSLKPTFRELLIKEKVNPIFFGTLNILSNGDTFSNFNTSLLGNINSDDLYTILKNEFEKNKIWLKTRNDIDKCKTCIYKNICPPISNYELIGKFNTICNR